MLVAASTHPGEDEQILSAARLAEEHVPGLMTILVPRHPERGAALVDLAWTAGFTVARRSAGERIQPGTGVYVTSGGVSQPTTAAAAEFDFDAMTAGRFYLYRPELGSPRGDNNGNSQSSSSGDSQH